MGCCSLPESNLKKAKSRSKKNGNPNAQRLSHHPDSCVTRPLWLDASGTQHLRTYNSNVYDEGRSTIIIQSSSQLSNKIIKEGNIIYPSRNLFTPTDKTQ
jgi:hypothetical protein